ncbi:MAG TPA: putative Ig domain-containing protein, partial [Pirellulaceae bacterium]
MWQSLGQDGSGWGVYGQRFDAEGNRVGGEFLVNGTTLGHQWHPDVAIRSDGTFAVTWEGRGSGDTDGIHAREFNALGVATGGEFLVNTTTRGNQSHPAIVAVVNDVARYLIGWHGRGDGDSFGAYTREISHSTTSERRLNDDDGGNQKFVNLAINGDHAIAVWQDTNGDDAGTAVRIQRLELTNAMDADPNRLRPMGGDLVANLSGNGPQQGPVAAVFDNGSFVAAWFGRGQEDGSGVYARRFGNDGVALSSELTVNPTAEGLQAKPSVAQVGDDFAIAWHGRGDADRFGVYARILNGPVQPNSPPTVITPLADQSVNEATAFTFNASTAFSDPDADPLTFSIAQLGGGALPAWLQFNTTTGEFSGTPTLTDAGITDIVVTATDPDGATASDTFRLTVVDNHNLAPTVSTPLVDQSVTEGTIFNFNASTAFTDPNGDVLTFSIARDGGGALPTWLQFNTTTGVFSGTPGVNDAGVVDIVVTASDHHFASVSDTFRLTVVDNPVPTLTAAIPDQGAVVGNAFSFNVASFFSDTESLTLSATFNLPSWLSFNATTGDFSGTPAESDVG